MKLLLIALFVSTASVQAQAPPLSVILLGAKASTAAALEVLKQTREYKAYASALDVEKSLEARLAAESKPVETPKP